MAIEECLALIKTASGGRLSDEEATELLQRAMDRAAALRADGRPSLQAAIQAARAEGDAGKFTALMERRERLINFRTRQIRREAIDENAQAIKGQWKDQYLSVALKDQVVALNTPMRGGRFSAEAEWKAKSSWMVGGLTSELDRAGLFKTAKSGVLDREIAREMAELNTDGGNPGVSGSKPALDIARIAQKYQALAKDGVNSAGGWIGDYMGYVTRTQHDPDIIRRMGWPAWRDLVMAKIDRERSFVGVDNPESWLQHIYNELETGVHLSDSRVGWKDAAFSGPGNRAKSVSQDRILHFKDADSWYDYQKATATGSLIQQITNALDRSARQDALMSRWGTNPRAEFEQDFQYLKEKYLDSDPAAVRALRDHEHEITTRFDYLDGTANMPANYHGARIMSYIRTIQSESHLGNVVFTHMSAGAFKASEASYRGIPLATAYANYFRSFLGRPAGSDLLRAGLEGMHRELISRFDINDTMPGKMASIANTYFRWTGLSFFMNAQKAGAETMNARFLGMQLDKSFGDLEPATQNALKLYNISPKDWDALRQAPDHPSIEGRPFLTPDAATRSTADMTDRARTQLAMKLHAYYADAADRSIVTPGIEERAMTLGGMQPGTLHGELFRTAMQFKMWPIAALRQGLFRDIRGSFSPGQSAMSILNLVLGTAVAGTAINAIIDVAKGLNPRPLNDPRTYIAGIMKGGGLGILGDYLFGEYNRFDQTPAEAVMGPTFGTLANTIVDIYNKLKGYAVGQIGGPDQKLSSLPAELFNTAINNTPFINMFYTRAALNYLLFWRIQEWLNPGYLQRMEQRRKQRTGQTYWLSPTSALH